MTGLDPFTGSDPVRRRLRRLSRRERLEEASAFLDQYARECGRPESERLTRRREVRTLIKECGTYWHTPQELAFGARVAWRNHARCAGRLTWNSLRVNDRRDIHDPEQVVITALADLNSAFRGGRIQSSISVYAPATETVIPTTFESPQLFHYAGYASDDGSVLGDRSNVEQTRIVEQLGWMRPSEPSAFDLLPVVVRDGHGRRHAFTVSRQAAHEIELTHPKAPAFNELGLRWYAVPCVTNMTLSIGGVDYPCAPFNGHYLATEIASRNLIDAKRYDLLVEIAEAFGCDPDQSLWQDTTLTELNRAVLHSFTAAGVRIVDHHKLSRDYIQLTLRERRAGRAVSGEWAWIVPPQASAACPTYHLPMTDLKAVPNFYHSRSSDGSGMRVDRTALRDGLWRWRYERAKRRFNDWRRRRDHLLQR